MTVYSLYSKFMIMGACILYSQCVYAEIPGDRIDRLLSLLTLEEKASLTSGASMWATKPIERLAIPSINMADGPHGIRKTVAGQFGNAEAATCYPTAVTLASTWNTALAYDVGAALGKEAQSQGIQILLGPGTNIKRSPYGGRNFEYFSEDPILSGKFSSAYIQGVQSEGVGVSLKHFAVNDQEHQRMTISAELSARALHEIYLRPFEIAVREAHPETLMSAYNKINGTYASNSEYLLNDVLRKQWGFDGIVMSDWGAVDDRVQGIRARLHLQMPGDGGLNDQKIIAAVNSGELAVAELDETIRSLLQTTLKLDHNKGKYDSYDQDAHHQLAYKVASEGIVLLKNKNQILPLVKGNTLAVIGNFARVPRYQGSGSSLVNPTKIDNLIDNLDASFAAGYDMLGRTTAASIAQASQLAKSVDKVVVVVGLTFLEESEGFDRSSFGIAPGHLLLLEAVIEANPRVIVVLQNGSPVAMPWLDRVDGVVEAYLGGQAGGRALADVLTGKVNPSGKLAETFPVKIEDNPAHIAWAGEEGKTYYNEGVFVGYRYYDKKAVEPLFPFGFGLSYSSFEFDGLNVNNEVITENDTLTASVNVKNIGEVAGHEVVQLYVRDKEASVNRPMKELKHFSKVFLQPGEEEVVSFQLSNRDFSFFSALHNRWILESGDFSILVGNSSRNLPLQKDVNLSVIDKPKQVFTKYSLVKEMRGHPVGKGIVDKIIENLTSGYLMQPTEGMSETERVKVMKVGITMRALIADMPIKNIVQFSKGEVSEEDLNNMIVVLNK